MTNQNNPNQDFESNSTETRGAGKKKLFGGSPVASTSDSLDPSTTPNSPKNSVTKQIWYFATGSPNSSKKNRYIRSTISALLLLSILGNSSASQDSPSTTETQQSKVSETVTDNTEPAVSQEVQKGVMPDIVGMNSFEAFTILEKADFAALFEPSFFDDEVASQDNFSSEGLKWTVCHQNDVAGKKFENPGYSHIQVSLDCTNWGVLPNVVGMNASDAWQLMINRGFSPTVDSSQDLTASQKLMNVCIQGYPEGFTDRDSWVTIELAKNCETDSSNPDSRDGTRIFVNQTIDDIKSIESDIDSLKRNALGNHTILINFPSLAISLKASSLQSKLPPTKFSKSWKKANQDLQTKIDSFDSALTDWVSDIISTNEFIPYIEALRSPVRNLKNLVNSIPYPK